jgi:hypothetical protein
VGLNPILTLLLKILICRSDSNFGDVTNKKGFFALSDASGCGFEKSCATNFAK